MGLECPAKEFWPYPVGKGKPLKELKKDRCVVKSAQRKQTNKQKRPACCVNVWFQLDLLEYQK